MSEQKSPEIFKKLLQFMALMDSFHDFAQGERVPGGPIDKKELFRLLNINNRLEIESNEYFSKGFTNDNNLIDGRTRGLVNRSSGGFEEGITKFLDGHWGNERGSLDDDYKVHNSLYWDKWNLDETKKQTIAAQVLEKGYWTEENEISYTGNRPKLIIWKKDDIENFNKIIEEQLIKIFGPDRELVFDYSAFNSKITKSLEKQGYIFKVSDSTMWDPATRKDATTGDDGEKIINNKPTSSEPQKYIYNTLYPYDIEPDEFGTENTQFCTNSKIKLLGINRGKGIGEIYPGKLIDFQKGRSVSQLGKFIRSQQNRRANILAKKKAQKNDSLETVFLDEDESKIGDFSPDEYNCNALDMKRSGDWGQVAYAKEYGGIFYSGDRMAIMYAIIQKCPYVFTGSILMIDGVKYSRMIIDPGVFDPKKFLETGIQDVNIFYTENIEILNKIYNCLSNTNNNPFNILITALNKLKTDLLESITRNYENIADNEGKKDRFEKYLTKFGGKIIKLFQMVNFIKVLEILSDDQYNLAKLLSEGISVDEDIYKNPIEKYYLINFTNFNLTYKLSIIDFFNHICDDLTPDLKYDESIESIDLLNPNIFRWSNRDDGKDILEDYKLTLHYNDELLYDKLKTLFSYFNELDATEYSLTLYSEDSFDFDAASILLAMIKNEYSELIKLFNNLPNYSVFTILNHLYTSNKNILNKMMDNSQLGLYTIYNIESKLSDLIQYEINSSNVNEKIYSEYISYYIHKYLFLPIYFVPYIISNDISKKSILDNIFTVEERSGKQYPKNGKIPINDLGLWQYYQKRGETYNTPFFRIGANTTDAGEGWFGDFVSESNIINLLNANSGVSQNNQLGLLYTILSYIVNISHCDIHECTKDIDINVFYKNYKNTKKEGFQYGLNNNTFKLRANKSNKKNKEILGRYIKSITNSSNLENSETIDIVNQIIESRSGILEEIDSSEIITTIDETIQILLEDNPIFNENDYERIIIPEIYPVTKEVDNTDRNKVYHLVLVEFFKLLKQAYILKSEHSNLTSEEEKFNWIVCDLKIELVKTTIYSIICHMPKRFTELGLTTLIKDIYDEFEPDNTDNTNYDIDSTTTNIYPNKEDLKGKINRIKENFKDIIIKIFNRQIMYIENNDQVIDNKLITIFDKIHNKLHNIHFIYNSFTYKNYYRNYKIINRNTSEKPIFKNKCTYDEDLDANIFSSNNNIIEILQLCNKDGINDILKKKHK